MYKSSMYVCEESSLLSVITDVDESVPKHTESTQTAENSLWNVALHPTTFKLL